MIYIISGDDVVVSRNKLNELIHDDKNITKFDAKKATIDQISKEITNGNLFESKLCIVIDNYTKIKPIEPLILVLKQAENSASIKVVLWDESEPPIKIKGSFKHASFSNFALPKVYFNFLDNISPRASNSTLELLQNLLKSYAAEQILYSIIKRIRQLLVIKTGEFKLLREFQVMQEWQIDRLQKQSKLWTELQLKKSLVSYLELDEKVKTSMLTMNLASHLDILLISDLN